MKYHLILETLKSYFNEEISNKVRLFENAIFVQLDNGNKIKIITKEKI